mgnify:CR=1 FL=1
MNVNSVMYSGKLDKPKANTYVNSDSKNEYDKHIVDSWRRCRNYGLTPYSNIEIRKLGGKELDSLLDRNRHLIEISLSYMENIYSLVKGTGFAISIVDEKGTILEVLGDKDLIDSISAKIEMHKGVILDERKVGNTSVSTSLISGVPIMFRGNEYFISSLKGLIASSAPIKRKGRVIGALNVMVSNEDDAEHAFAIAVSTAKVIESQIEVEDVREEVLSKSQYQHAIVECSSDGFLTIDSKGILTYINQTGADILGINRENSIGKYVGDLVDFEPVILNVLRTGKGYTDKEFIVRNNRNGVKHHFVKSAIPMRDEKGNIIGVIDHFRKIKRVHNMMRDLGGNYAKFTFDDIIGNSSKIRECIRLGEIAARSSSNVLIYGESGTGKEMIAQSIHNASSRRDESFISINCAAIPSELMESELFGYEGGAFTGALKSGQIGKFELADGGTIFLDEIGDMPLHMQAKLLRVLQEKQFTRVGGRDILEVDVRIICATNKDLLYECKRGNFREDLYYRLNVLNIYLPPLRERMEDLEPLVYYFIKKINKRINGNVEGISWQALELLKNYHWPGNVRQLENVIERAINICPGKIIGINQISNNLPERIKKQVFSDAKPYNNLEDNNIKSLEEIEREAIEKVLTITENNISQAANLLKISRNTIYNKMRKYGIVI